jgi:hypothetical protein
LFYMDLRTACTRQFEISQSSVSRTFVHCFYLIFIAIPHLKPDSLHLV